jgi:serine/threonine-protein kinase RsbW
MQIRFAGRPEDIAGAYARVAEALDAADLDGACRYKVELVFDEVVSNIVHYGAPDGRILDICFALEVRSDEVGMTFDDDGVVFDSSALTPRPVSTSLEEAQIGGFGLILVHKMVSSLQYARTIEGRNRLLVTVRRDAPAVSAPAS